MAYVELLCAEYHMTPAAVFRLPFAAGCALLEARQARLNPGAGISWIDRAIVDARRACRRRLRQLYRIIPNG